MPKKLIIWIGCFWSERENICTARGTPEPGLGNTKIVYDHSSFFQMFSLILLCFICCRVWVIFDWTSHNDWVAKEQQKSSQPSRGVNDTYSTSSCCVDSILWYKNCWGNKQRISQTLRFSWNGEYNYMHFREFTEGLSWPVVEILHYLEK